MTKDALLALLQLKQYAASKLARETQIDVQQHFQDGRQAAFRELEAIIREEAE